MASATWILTGSAENEAATRRVSEHDARVLMEAVERRRAGAAA